MAHYQLTQLQSALEHELAAIASHDRPAERDVLEVIATDCDLALTEIAADLDAVVVDAGRR